MGKCASKIASTPKSEKKRAKNSPPNSPLGRLLDGWENWEETKELDKIKIIHFCVEVWPELDLQGEWPWVGTQDIWMCKQLNEYLKAWEDPDLEELRYAACWLENAVRDRGMKICKLQGKKEEVKKEEDKSEKKWDPLENLAPPIPLIPLVPPPLYPASPPANPLPPPIALVTCSPPVNPATAAPLTGSLNPSLTPTKIPLPPLLASQVQSRVQVL